MYFVIDIYRHFQKYPQTLEKMTSPFLYFFPYKFTPLYYFLEINTLNKFSLTIIVFHYL